MAERAHPPFLNYQPKISGAGGGPRPPDRGGEGGSFLSALPAGPGWAGLGCGRLGAARRGTARHSVEGRPSPQRAALPARASCHRHYPEPLSNWESRAPAAGCRSDPLSSVPAPAARAGASLAGLFPSADPPRFRRLTVPFRRRFSYYSPKAKEEAAVRAHRGMRMYFE